VDVIAQIRECHDDLFWSGNARLDGQPQATLHEFILDEDDHHFLMYFVNKVMGPHLTSDNKDVVNKDDNCAQHSSFGKNGFVHFHNLQNFI